MIAAVVIGGGSLSGGEGTVLGTLIGCLIMSVLNNGCVHAGIPNASQDIIIGAIIVAAVDARSLPAKARRPVTFHQDENRAAELKAPRRRTYHPD